MVIAGRGLVFLGGPSSFMPSGLGIYNDGRYATPFYNLGAVSVRDVTVGDTAVTCPGVTVQFDPGELAKLSAQVQQQAQQLRRALAPSRTEWAQQAAATKGLTATLAPLQAECGRQAEAAKKITKTLAPFQAEWAEGVKRVTEPIARAITSELRRRASSRPKPPALDRALSSRIAAKRPERPREHQPRTRRTRASRSAQSSSEDGLEPPPSRARARARVTCWLVMGSGPH